MGVFVQALASRGVATALSGALLSTRPVDQLVVSPQLCGSSLWMIPNPRGSLTYRFAVIITAWTDVCQPRRLKKIFAMTSQRLPVLVHDTGEQHAVGGRGVCNGIGSGLDGAEDRLLCGAAGGDDGDLGMTTAIRTRTIRTRTRATPLTRTPVMSRTQMIPQTAATQLPPIPAPRQPRPPRRWMPRP